MAATLLAVVIAILLAHTRPEFARLRQFDWYEAWLQALSNATSGTRFWQHGAGLVLSLGAPVLLIAVVQYGLDGRWFGLLSVVFGTLILFGCWGPRDLDLDVQAIQSATDTPSRHHAIQQLPAEPPVPPIAFEAGALIDATFRAGLTRWFAVLFWFWILGPTGAVLYRLTQLAAQTSALRNALSEAQRNAAEKFVLILEWAPAHLMTMALALAADFDAVAQSWRNFHVDRGRYFSLDLGFLNAAGRASVRIEETEDEEDLGTTALPTLARELGFAMALVWRILIVWLLVFAIMVLAGWMA